MEYEYSLPIFECTLCGDCCKGYGGTVITSKDAEAIAALLDIPLKQFIQSYCVVSGNRTMLAQQENGYCVFWDRLCTIHAVKPKMCKAWPYIESVLIDTHNWRIMASGCPGMRTDAADERIVEETARHVRGRV